MLKAIKTRKQHAVALEKIYRLMQKDLKPGSKQMNELEVLSILVEKYEDEHYPIEPPDPVEAIKLQMIRHGLTRTDIAEYLGYKSRVSEVLKRKRKLTLPMIRSLHRKLKIPLETLIKEY